jgi:hypothetical protein
MQHVDGAAQGMGVWGAWKSNRGGPTIAGKTTSLVMLADAYNGEVFAFWKLLSIEYNIPVDFLSEDSLTNSTVLANYGSIVITEPNVPSKSLAGALVWVKSGPNRTLILSPFAGQFDEYNQPAKQLYTATGVSHPLTTVNAGF